MTQFGTTTRNLVTTIVMAILLAVAVPATSIGKDKQGRWRDRNNRDNWDWSRRDRKCRKFRNCHDARDGRWDGRGPRGQRVGRRDQFRHRQRNRNDEGFLASRRVRNRNFDNSRLWQQRRARWNQRYN